MGTTEYRITVWIVVIVGIHIFDNFWGKEMQFKYYNPGKNAGRCNVSRIAFVAADY